MNRKLLLLCVFTFAFIANAFTQTFQIKPRVNYFHHSKYVGKAGSSFVYTDGSTGGGNRIESFNTGKGFEFQLSLSRISDLSQSLDNMGYGLVLNVKNENNINSYNNFKENVTFFDLGVAFYLVVYECHLGYGISNFSNPLWFEYLLFPTAAPTGKDYFFIRQYLNIPIYKGFSITGGLTINTFKDKFIVNGAENRWRNMYFNYGIVYKFHL